MVRCVRARLDPDARTERQGPCWEPKRLRLFSAACRPSARHPVRLTSQNHLDDQEENHRGPWNPRPPGAVAGAPVTPERRKSTPAEHLTPPHHRRERSRLTLEVVPLVEIRDQ